MWVNLTTVPMLYFKELCNVIDDSANSTFIYHHHYHHHYQSVLHKGNSFTANTGTKVAVLSKGVVASHCFLHPILSLASEQTLKDPRGSNAEVKRVDFLLTVPSGLHQNSPQGLNISSIRILTDLNI